MALGVRLGLFLTAVSCIYLVSAVDRNNFKTCEQSSFCRRCRKVEPEKTPYKLLNSVEVQGSELHGELFNKDTGVLYVLRLTGLVDNTFRVYINEKNPLRERYEVQDALHGEPTPTNIKVVEQTAEYIVVATDSGTKAKLFLEPFRIDLFLGDRLVLSVNARGLMRFEHLRTKALPKPEGEESEKPAESEPEFPGDGAEADPGAWEENFKSHQDSKPYGPEAVALDFTFVGAEHSYGIPEHAGSFALKSTKKTDPYRLYNLDVFEYEIDDFMALYGAIPVIFGHGKEGTSGVFWHNAAETWIDITSSSDSNVVESIVNFVSGTNNKPQVNAHFMSESGVIDIFLMLGPKPFDAFKQYTRLTGTPPLPQIFGLGYHQSRWNYNDQDDVKQIADTFDKYDLPMEAMWLDIEYADGKKYFTWDPRKFSQPLDMIRNLTEKGRKLVIIVDPHTKRDPNYFIHNEATSLGYYVKDKNGKDFEGWCWPGASSYLDFFNPVVREYYKEQYSLDKFKGTTNDVYLWNDMNEPSVFNGPEVTMPKDMIQHPHWEHRDIHNIHGLMVIRSTHEALFKRSGGSLRPFVLTRSFFAGSQRYGTMWTGDNSGEWSHLRISYPMCLSMAVAGYSFCGADVGGFFKNPDVELFTRWNQAGAWLPFFRQHSHIETRRREPWTFDEKTTSIVKDTLKRRYSFLPLWYTLFREAELYGDPVIRPIWAHYPQESEAFAIDDHILVGDSILVRPVFEPGVNNIDVYFPGEGKVAWYNIDTLKEFKKPGFVNIPVTIERIPVFQRAGSIISRKMRSRRSTVAMKNDPYTLTVIADAEGKASSNLYIDDETSFEYKHGKYLYIKFSLDDKTLKSEFLDKLATYETKSWIERIDVVNPPKGIKSARLTSKGLGVVNLDAKYNPTTNVLTIRKPGVNMGAEWSIELID